MTFTIPRHYREFNIEEAEAFIRFTGLCGFVIPAGRTGSIRRRGIELPVEARRASIVVRPAEATQATLCILEGFVFGQILNDERCLCGEYRSIRYAAY